MTTYRLTPRADRINRLRAVRARIDAEIHALLQAEVNALEPTPHPDCGTETAYKRHKRHGEHACTPCRHAHNAYSRGELERNERWTA